MMTFVDDYCKMVFLYFLRQKSQALEIFTEFKNMIENQTDHKIKILRTDNGGEYVSNDFDKFCKNNGIIHQLSVPHTPQQNGVAERMNRTIVEKARCLLFDADLNKKVTWLDISEIARQVLR